MKQIVKELYWDARNQLLRMQKSKMSLADRIAYERALEKMELVNKLIEKCEIIFKQ